MHRVKMKNLKFRFSHLKDNRLQLDRIKAIISTLEDLMYYYCCCIKLMFTCKTALVFSVSSSLIGLVGGGGSFKRPLKCNLLQSRSAAYCRLHIILFFFSLYK